MGPPKLTKEIINVRLIGRNIELIGNYEYSNIKTQWLCTKKNCGYDWFATANSVLQGCGCSKCINHIRLTDEIVDCKLIKENRSIKRLGHITGNKDKIEWQCLIDTCNYIWKTTSKSILNIGSGCPECAGLTPLTNEHIDTKLIGRNIKRISNYANNRTNMRWLCLIDSCNHSWETTSKSVVNNGRGCPKCNLPGVNEKLMLKLLEDNGLKYKFQYGLRKIDTNSNIGYFDAYFPEIKLAIEYNGSQHYTLMSTGFFGSADPIKMFKSQQIRDEYKRNFCIENNIKLIEIDGRKYFGLRLKKYIEEYIIPYICNFS